MDWKQTLSDMQTKPKCTKEADHHLWTRGVERLCGWGVVCLVHMWHLFVLSEMDWVPRSTQLLLSNQFCVFRKFSNVAGGRYFSCPKFLHLQTCLESSSTEGGFLFADYLLFLKYLSRKTPQLMILISK